MPRLPGARERTEAPRLRSAPMSRRDQILMTPDEMRTFLDEGRDLQVASINADGTPHLVTMW